MNGEPCFRGTRVPVRLLFDYLAAGAPLSEFLEHSPAYPIDQNLPHQQNLAKYRLAVVVIEAPNNRLLTLQA